MKLHVKVIPNASKDEVVEDLEDLIGARTLKIKVSKPPEDGQANKAMIALLAKYLNVKKRAVSIVSGATSRNKIVEVELN